MIDPSKGTRRDFLKAGVTAAAALTVLPHWAAEQTTKRKAAVIGYTGRGDYGHGLEAIFSNRPDIQVVAVADPDEAAGAKVAAKIGAARHYADYRQMLAKEKPELVSIAMRQADVHHEIALACLQSGAHIYSEKPFTTTPAEADELLAEAQRRRLKIGVAHTMRMMPVMQAFKAAMGGLIGDLQEMRAYGKQDLRAGGEDMMVLGSHLFDLLRMFAGDPLWCSARVLSKGRDITAADGRLVKDNVGLVAGDQVFAHFGFSGGVNATFTSAAKMRESYGHWGIEVFGSKGVARINCDISPNVFIRKSSAWKAEGQTDGWVPLDMKEVAPSAPRNPGPVGDWLEAITKDREPECSGRNGAWAVEMVLAVYHAALTGKRANFPLAVRTHPLKGA